MRVLSVLSGIYVANMWMRIQKTMEKPVIDMCQDHLHAHKIDGIGKADCIFGWWFGTFFIFHSFGNNHPI